MLQKKKSPGRPGLWPILLLLLWMGAGCDSDRFLGSNYEARSVASVIRIEGELQNVFTGDEVDSAEVSINFQRAYSGVDGHFSLNYVLEANAGMSVPVPLTIRADKYYPIDTTLTVLPADNYLNVSLTYAAPLVPFSQRFPPGSNPDAYPIEALVFDYQGIATVDSVKAIGLYWDGTYKIRVETTFPMVRRQVVDQYSAWFEGELPGFIYNLNVPEPSLSAIYSGIHGIYVRDNEGYWQRAFFTY